MQTGITAVDADDPMRPWAAELIMAIARPQDRQSHRHESSNQKANTLSALYVANRVRNQPRWPTVVDVLRERGALDYPVVAASARTCRSSISAPYTGAAIAELLHSYKARPPWWSTTPHQSRPQAYRQMSAAAAAARPGVSLPRDVFYLPQPPARKSAKLFRLPLARQR